VVTVESVLRHLVPRFIDNRRKDFHAMTEALGRGDFQLIYKLSHNIKGVGGSFGFDALGALAADMETAALASDAEALRRRLSEYGNYLERVDVVYE